MGKIQFTGLTVLMLICFLFAACPEGGGDDVSGIVTVNFDLGYNGAAAISPLTLDKGQAAGNAWPANPVRLGYSFDGWYAGDVFYDSLTAIGSNVTLTAKWSVDLSGLVDQPSGGELADLFSVAGGFPANAPRATGASPLGARCPRNP